MENGRLTPGFRESKSYRQTGMGEEKTSHQPRSTFQLRLDQQLLELNSRLAGHHQHQQEEGEREERQRDGSFAQQRHPIDPLNIVNTALHAKQAQQQHSAESSLPGHVHVNLENTNSYNPPQQYLQQYSQQLQQEEEGQLHPHHHFSDSRDYNPNSESHSKGEVEKKRLVIDTLSPSQPSQHIAASGHWNQDLRMGVLEQPVPSASRPTPTPTPTQRHKTEGMELKHERALNDNLSVNEGASAAATSASRTSGKAGENASKVYPLKKTYVSGWLKGQDDTPSKGLESRKEKTDKAWFENQTHPDKNQQQTFTPHNERRLYEPPKRVTAMQDNKISPSNCNTQRVEHEFQHLGAEEVEELRIWLASTGYHDINYRRKTINRHKRLAALEAERTNLMREEQLDREAWANKSDVATTPSFTPIAPDTSVPSLSATQPSSPSLTTTASHHADSESKRIGLGLVNEVHRRQPPDGSQPSTSLKRDYSTISGDQSERPKAARIGRTSTGNRDTRDSYEGPRGTQRQQDHGSPTLGGKDHQASREYNNPLPPLRGENGFHSGNQIRGRGGRPLASRGGRRGGVHSPQGQSSFFGEERLKPKEPGSCFFLIKSIDYEYVNECQQDGIWITQHKNMEKLAKAFESHREVILFFSVNESKAFQGYARMECAPGGEDISPPQWAFKLGFHSNPPFRVKWINTFETQFWKTGHLKNSYNEDAPVLFGRDGQEIDPQSGMGLCDLIDDLSNNA